MKDETVILASARLLRRLTVQVFTVLEGVSFWLAVVIPLAYIPLLLRGLATAAQAVLFTQLLFANVLALVLGHRYPP